MRLQRITINGTAHDLRNIVVIIGPNNAGKTKLLEDLYFELVHSHERTPEDDYIRVSSQNNVWPQMIDKGDFHYSRDEANKWVDAHKPWKKSQDSARVNHMMLRSKNNALQWGLGNEGAMYQDELDQVRLDPLLRREWLVRFKKSHIQFANIDSRFTDASQIESIDISNNDNPKLFFTQAVTLKILNQHLKKLFNKKFIVLQYSPIQYQILLIDDNVNDYPRWARSNNFEANQRTIEKHADYIDENTSAYVSHQSHGTRAATSILIALTDKYRKIVFIDEPESHIYPAARKYMGTLIADASVDRQFFVVTHDVELLERLANSRKNFSVLKLNRKREIKLVDYNTSRRRRVSSELKSTKALRAGFNDVAIFVEGPSDKYIYESVLRRKKLIDESIEYGVIDCDGNDRIADSVKFSQDIDTKVAVITDFDTIFAEKKKSGGVLERILDSLQAPSAIKDSVQTVRANLKEGTLKTKGLMSPTLSVAQGDAIKDLLAQLKVVGVFVVPHGELYDWFSADKSSVPVESLRNRYFNNSKKYQELTDFLTEVAKFVSM